MPHQVAPNPVLRIDVLTLFPELIEHALHFGVTGRARERGLWQLGLWNPRDFAADSYKTIDDRPYGGGPGMVMVCGPLRKAMAAIRNAHRAAGFGQSHVVYLSPAGTPLDHGKVTAWAQDDDTAYVLLAGRYEGVDERFLRAEVDDEIAIGDIVVSGGEFPALMLIDAVVRQRPGVLNDADSAAQDSFVNGLLDCPHYTRPQGEGGDAVPAVLLSGDHAAIAQWRLKQALGRTWERRPDLLLHRSLSTEEEALLAQYRREQQAMQQ